MGHLPRKGLRSDRGDRVGLHSVAMHWSGPGTFSLSTVRGTAEGLRMPTFRGKGETAAQRLASHRPVAQAAGRGVQTAAHGARPTHSQKTFAPVTLCGIGGVHHRAQLRDDAPPAPAHLGIVYHQKQGDRSRAPKQVAITDPKTFLRSPRQDRARQGQGRRGRPIGAQGDGVAREGGALNAIAGPERLLLRTQVALYGEDLRTVGEFALEAGQSIPFVISYGPSFQPPPPAIDCFEKPWRARKRSGATGATAVPMSGLAPTRSNARSSH
jgi:hypothetical protein